MTQSIRKIDSIIRNLRGVQMQPHQGYQYYIKTLMFPRDTVAPVHCESVSKVTKYIKPLDTERGVETTFN